MGVVRCEEGRQCGSAAEFTKGKEFKKEKKKKKKTGEHTAAIFPLFRPGFIPLSVLGN